LVAQGYGKVAKQTAKLVSGTFLSGEARTNMNSKAAKKGA
jgi:hypothetical protein